MGMRFLHASLLADAARCHTTLPRKSQRQPSLKQTDGQKDTITDGRKQSLNV